MSRKKFKTLRSSRTPNSERSFYQRSITEDHPTLAHLDLLNIIKGGEDSYIELKVRLTNSEKIITEIVGLANSGGGAIIFGVNDNRRIEGIDDPEQIEQDLRNICQNQITPSVHPYIDKVFFDNGRRIVVLEVNEHRAPHYAFDYRFYIREGSSVREARNNEVAGLFTKLRPANYESVPLLGTSVDDIDESFVWTYIRELQGDLFNSRGNYPTGQALRDMLLGVEQNEVITPTVAGLLLFGKNKLVADKFNRSCLVIKRFSGDTTTAPIIEQAEFRGNLASIFERTQAFISRYADLWDSPNARKVTTKDTPVDARANYSRAIITEALTNALVHRDYCVREQPTKVNLFDKRIEIFNPCATRLALKSIELYGAISAPNARLKAVFKAPAYGLKTVTGGILMMRHLAHRYSNRDLKLSLVQDEFKIEIFAS